MVRQKESNLLFFLKTYWKEMLPQMGAKPLYPFMCRRDERPEFIAFTNIRWCFGHIAPLLPGAIHSLLWTAWQSQGSYPNWPGFWDGEGSPCETTHSGLSPVIPYTRNTGKCCGHFGSGANPREVWVGPVPKTLRPAAPQQASLHVMMFNQWRFLGLVFLQIKIKLTFSCRGMCSEV